MSSSQKWEKEKTYKLDFTARAYKELFKLPEHLQSQLVNKLKERLRNPRIEKDKLSGMPDCYKIKLKSAGYRLVYRVIDEQVVVLVIAIGKRERGDIYKTAQSRLQ